MELTKEIVQGLMILLPGFVTTGVIRSLHYGDIENDFDKVNRSLIYTFVNYLIYTLILQLWAWRFHQGGASATPLTIEITTALPTSPLQFLLLFAIAIAVGIVTVAYKTHNGHRLFKILKVSNRTTRPNIWHDTFQDYGNTYVIVNFEDGLRLFGWVAFYDDDVSQRMLYVTHADWLTVDDEGNQIVTPCHENGILLLSDKKINYIEFMGKTEDEARKRLAERVKLWCGEVLRARKQGGSSQSTRRESRSEQDEC